MADLIDMATDYQTRNTAAAISEALAPVAGAELEPIIINGIACCAECEKPIPPRRLQAIRTGLCVHCADAAQRA